MATLISLFLCGLVWVNFQSHHRAFLTQTHSASMHADLRSALSLLEEDIRMAGYSPALRNESAEKTAPGIVLAGKDCIRITMDRDGNGDTAGPDEDITYRIEKSDGIPALKCKRSEGPRATFQPVVNHVEALDFVYLDVEGNPLDTGGLDLLEHNLGRIRCVQILLVLRSAWKDRRFIHAEAIRNLQGSEVLTAKRDHYLRAHLRKTVCCRNLGLAAPAAPPSG